MDPDHGRGAQPRMIGPYAVERRLGSGGMGTVYLARDAAGRAVAVKMIHEHLRSDPTFRSRFAAEVAAARRVAGFCTARVLDADVTGPTPYLVSEYVSGPALHDLVASHGPLSTSDTEALAVGVAAALTAIHAAGIVHRDLTPRNVMLSPFGPKVIDFGIARPFPAPGAAATVAWGTPGWVPPEYVYGQPIGPAADIFSWGLLIAWAGTGRHPFGAEGAAGTMRAPVGVPDITGLDGRLAPLVAAALQTDPTARPTARELLLTLCGSTEDARVRTAVAPLATPTAVLPTVRQPVAPRPARIRRRGSRWPVFVLLAVALLACCTAGLLRNVGQGDDPDGGNPGGRPATTTTRPAPKGPPTGRDGVLEFAVTKLDCARKKLTNLTEKTTKGQFCLLTLRVRNVGDRAARVWASSQQLVDGEGREYRADDFAWFYHSPAAGLAPEVNPGNTVNLVLVYDTPAGQRFAKVVVRDAPLSFGTSIALR